MSWTEGLGNITTTTITQTATLKHPNNVLILTKGTPANALTDGFKLYGSAREVEADFGTSSKTYKIVSIMFQQTTNPIIGEGSIAIATIEAGKTALEVYNSMATKLSFSKLIATELFVDTELTDLTSAIQTNYLKDDVHAFLGTASDAVIEANTTAGRISTDFLIVNDTDNDTILAGLQAIAGITSKICGRIYQRQTPSSNAETENYALVGVVGDKTINDTSKNALLLKGACLYGFYLNTQKSMILYSTANGGKLDFKWGVSALRILLRNARDKGLTDNNLASSLVYNNSILQSIINLITFEVVNIFLDANLLSKDIKWDPLALPLPGYLTAEKINNGLENNGVFIDIQDINTMTAEDRAAGKSPAIAFYVVYKSRITELSINVNINQ